MEAVGNCLCCLRCCSGSSCCSLIDFFVLGSWSIPAEIYPHVFLHQLFPNFRFSMVVVESSFQCTIKTLSKWTSHISCTAATKISFKFQYFMLGCTQIWQPPAHQPSKRWSHFAAPWELFHRQNQRHFDHKITSARYYQYMFEGNNNLLVNGWFRIYLSFKPPVLRTIGTEPYRIAIICGWKTSSNCTSED